MAFQHELALEELFYGKPFSPQSVQFSISLGKDSKNPNSLTKHRGFLGLSPVGSASAGEDSPPIETWISDQQRNPKAKWNKKDVIELYKPTDIPSAKSLAAAMTGSRSGRRDFLLGFCLAASRLSRRSRSLQLSGSPQRAFSTKRAPALLQMPRRRCHSCSALLQSADGHGECALCLGAAHAEAALTETECPHCEDMSLASLRSRVALFSERDPASRALPLSSSQEPVRKKQRGREPQRSAASELTPAQPPRASPSPQRESSPVLFSRPDQRPSAHACDLVSFGGSDDEALDDSMSLAASDAEEMSGSSHDPAPPAV
ncbi:hypothetical protein Q8A67_012685 [Cirrhinus molitorella]|uniref:Uncharacterized protein n=1 Tax=Cirrhinus molitorella TaxID=172907 RepID=A0AA88TMM6_9TELE|nr:hypothetical protein Q8A67_012685 [Cirrhinus molitorella]